MKTRRRFLSLRSDTNEFHERRFKENIARSRKRIDELEANPPEPCESCGHVPYPIVAVQHCWCDPDDR